MATGPGPIEITAAQFLAATPTSSAETLNVPTATHPIAFKPFPQIADELYRTYQPLKQS